MMGDCRSVAPNMGWRQSMHGSRHAPAAFAFDKAGTSGTVDSHVVRIVHLADRLSLLQDGGVAVILTICLGGI